MRRIAAALMVCGVGVVVDACAGAPSPEGRPSTPPRGSAGAAKPDKTAGSIDGGDAAVGAPIASAPMDGPLDLAPSARAAKASIFGTDVIGLPSGAALSPDAAPGSTLLELDPHLLAHPRFRAMGAVATALSPDGKTLLVLTSGYNKLYDAKKGAPIEAASGEYVFVYDVGSSGGASHPRETQVIRLPNSFVGLAWHPKGDRFYVSGGPDDCVHEIVWAKDSWRQERPPFVLGHRDKLGYGGFGIKQSPYAAGVALSASGAKLVVANHENDSLSIVDTARGAETAEISVAAGAERAGGEFPFGVVVVGESRAYVTSQRDRELVEVDLDKGSVLRRIKVGGMPTRVIANRDGTRLYVANANSDTVSVVDREAGRVIDDIATATTETTPGFLRPLRGANPNGLALSPDELHLYVSNGGINAVAIIALGGADREQPKKQGQSRVLGLVPTALYPHDVAIARDGLHLYVAYGKSPTVPNPRGPWLEPRRSAEKPYAIAPGNEYALQLVRGGLHAFPVPAGPTLEKLTRQSLLDNRFVDQSAQAPPTFDVLRRNIKHVIYVVGENRTYDQLLGDLKGADGDPKLVHWGERITPNHHALAQQFVALDRFFDSGGVSGDGWQWTVGGRSTDVAEKEIPLEYADRGHHPYDWEGTNRAINIGVGTLSERLAFNPNTPNRPEWLPGTGDVASIDGPDEGGRGFLWEVAQAAGLQVRNYGFFVDDYRYWVPKTDRAFVPLTHMPFDAKLRVAYPCRPSLMAVTDPYFRGYDLKFADYWRFREWERELDQYVAKGELPALSLVRFPHDHLGAFATADDAVDTPDTQMADHDYAIGLLVEKLSSTPFWRDTIVVAIEDDAQNGSDHVDSHRSIALIAGAYVKRGAVVSTPYTTTSVLRTIELLLGLPALGRQDAVAPAMADVFQASPDMTPYKAIVPQALTWTRLPVPKTASARDAASRPRGDRDFWAGETAGYDFTRADAIPTEHFNRLLFCTLVDPSGCASVTPPTFALHHADGAAQHDDD